LIHISKCETAFLAIWQKEFDYAIYAEHMKNTEHIAYQRLWVWLSDNAACDWELLQSGIPIVMISLHSMRSDFFVLYFVGEKSS
jgi:hypothetical protein